MKTLIILIVAVAGLTSCNQPAKQQGFPIVNTLKTLSPWVITRTAVSGGADHFYYRKGDSTRYVMVVNNRVMIDQRSKSISSY